jgi:hypothetical protein
MSIGSNNANLFTLGGQEENIEDEKQQKQQVN